MQDSCPFQKFLKVFRSGTNIARLSEVGGAGGGVIQSYTIYANFGLSILKKLASPFKAFKASQGRYIYMHNPHRELL